MAYTDQMDFLRRNMQGHPQRNLKGRPGPPDNGQYFGGSGMFMGNRPRGTSKDNRVPLPNAQSPNAAYDTDNVWPYFLPWFVIYPGELHKSVNTEIIISYIKYGFYSDVYNGWDITTYDSGFGHKHLDIIAADTVNDPVGYTYDAGNKLAHYQFNAGLNPIHGWKVGRVTIPNPQNLKCIYLEISATLGLIDDQGTDDRDSSEFMLVVAADYYPHVTETMSVPMVGGSRFVRVHNGTTKINFATISPPGAEWYRHSDYTGRVSMTDSEFVATDPTFLPTA